MIPISKGSGPNEYIEWIKSNKDSPNFRYGENGFPTDSVKVALIDEQRRLCAYTMKRISVVTAHNEHLKPQKVCREEGGSEDVAWSNLVACSPGPNQYLPYGAVKKGSWWDHNLFVSPLTANCYQRFLFDMKTGEVRARNEHDTAAKTTIKMLNLNAPELVELRHRVTVEFGFHPRSKKQRTIKQTQEFIGKFNFPGYFPEVEFPLTLYDAAVQWLKFLERAARDRKYSRSKR